MTKLFNNPYVLAITIVLAIAMIVGIVFLAIELFKPKSTTTIGEIVYVTQRGDSHNTENKPFLFYVYVKPLSETENEDWILFTVDQNTLTESQKSTDPLTMPELSVGTIVEIVRNKNIDRPKYDLPGFIYGFYAESIKVYNGETDGLKDQEIPLILNKKYEFDQENVNYSQISSGRLVGVIKVESPINGYIIYIHPDDGDLLKKYWIDTNTIMDDDTRNLIESETTGVRIYESVATDFTPFKNENKDVNTVFRLFIDWKNKK